MEYTHEEILRWRENLEYQIASYQESLYNLQEECPHPLLQSVNKSDTGNYDPSADCYWTEHSCPSCGKKWIEEK